MFSCRRPTRTYRQQPISEEKYYRSRNSGSWLAVQNVKSGKTDVLRVEISVTQYRSQGFIAKSSGFRATFAFVRRRSSRVVFRRLRREGTLLKLSLRVRISPRHRMRTCLYRIFECLRSHHNTQYGLAETCIKPRGPWFELCRFFIGNLVRKVVWTRDLWV